jgi:8-oxo-dGTP pyrophosphatase MutT (NUDIX family)
VEAAAREMKEETGYEVSPKDLISVFNRYKDDDGFSTETFLLPFKLFNPIKQDTLDSHETGVVRWVNWQTLFDGPFGAYNKQLYLEIKDKLEELNA